MRIANCEFGAIARLSARAIENLKRALIHSRATAPILLVLFAVSLSVSAQTTAVNTPAKVTVTLVRWPYT
jgi:hypothetical protein